MTPPNKSKVKKVKDVEFKIGPPPIHTHYDCINGEWETRLCGRVVCPYGFVGVTLTYPNPKENK